MTGSWLLLRMALRRDRVLLPSLVAVFVVVAASSAGATEGLYRTQGSRVAAAQAVNAAPALVALYGPVYDVRSLGALAFFKLIVLGAALVGLLTSLLVIRHTRADEELGRTELVAAGSVGRHASLLAGVLLAGGTAVVVGVLTAAAVRASGFTNLDSVALGAAWAGSGVAFSGVAAVAAQLTAGARSARGFAAAALGGAYLARAAADATDTTWLLWLSPVGWAEQVRPFSGDRLWPVLPLLALGAAATALAVRLSAGRDLGSGVIPDRPGPARGVLGTPSALAFRLHRGAVVGWTVGFVVFGLVLGSLVTNLDGFLDDPTAREIVQRLGGTRVITDAFMSTELGFSAFLTTAFGLSTVTRMRAEESSGRLENVLATATGRTRWLGSHVTAAGLGTTVLTLAAGLSAGAAHALQSGVAGDVFRDLAAATVRLPAIWVLVAATVVLFGLNGRWTTYGWALLVGCVVVGEFGDLMGLPEPLQDVSPFTHVPPLPGGTFDAGPVLTLLLLVVVLLVAGLAAFRRRDVLAG